MQGEREVRSVEALNQLLIVRRRLKKDGAVLVGRQSAIEEGVSRGTRDRMRLIARAMRRKVRWQLEWRGREGGYSKK